MPMTATWIACALVLSSGGASTAGNDASPSAAAAVAPVELPTSVDDALGLEGASVWRRVGVASLLSGALLGVVSAGAFSAGFEAERELRAAPHSREQADTLLFERAVAAAVAYPAFALAVVGVGAGVGCLWWEDEAGGWSDGHEEVTP